ALRGSFSLTEIGAYGKRRSDTLCMIVHFQYDQSSRKVGERTMQQEVGKPYVLGLDLGVASIGWAIIELNDQREPDRIIRVGVHIFEAGVEGGRGALAKGNEKSKALPRRLARGQRKLTWRRAFRKRQVLKRLIRYGLLPTPEKRLATPEDIDAYLKSIDAGLRMKWEALEDVENDERHRIRQLLPYRLRA